MRIPKLRDYSIYILLPIVFVFSIEVISAGGVFPLLKWIAAYPRECLISFLLAFALLNVFAFFPRAIYLNIINVIFVLALGLSYANRMKIKLRSEPILPWDLQLQKEALNIAKYFDSISIKGLIIVLLVLVIIVEAYIFMRAVKSKNKTKSFLVSIISVMLLFNLYANRPFPLHQTLRTTTITWDQGAHYSQNGFLLGFFLNLRMFTIEEPVGYTQKRIESISNKAAIASVNSTTVETVSVKPNIIIIMSEAFWDPTAMDNLSFSKDCLPFFREMQKDYTSGKIITPVYGGGTVNTEFEVLTGLSTKFIRSGAIVYSQYLNRPIDSIARILSEEGYSTTAIHPYHNWFYKRNTVFKLMGFDRFISSEFMYNPEYRGQFISDHEVTKMIINQTQRTKEKDFVFAVTMQNHGPYDIENNDNNNDTNEDINEDINEDSIVVKGQLSEESRKILEYYARNIYYSDQALKELVEYYEESQEPTVILFFGDHLPMLGDNRQVYTEAKFLEGKSSYEEYLRLYGVPFVIWDNYLENRENNLCMSTNFIPAYILNMVGISKGSFMEYLSGVYERGLKIIPNIDYYEELEIDVNSIDEYKLLQYDLLFGKRYLYGGEQLKEKDSYYLGYGELLISNIEVDSKEAIMKVIGKGFTKSSIIFINDEQMETILLDDNNLKALMPKEFLEAGKEMEVRVKIVDSLDRILYDSNTLKMTMRN